MAAAAWPQPWSAATPSSTSAPLEATKKTSGMREATGLIGRLGQPHPVGVGDGAPPLQRVGPGHDHVAAADAADARSDGRR